MYELLVKMTRIAVITYMHKKAQGFYAIAGKEWKITDS